MRCPAYGDKGVIVEFHDSDPGSDPVIIRTEIVREERTLLDADRFRERSVRHSIRADTHNRYGICTTVRPLADREEWQYEIDGGSLIGRKHDRIIFDVDRR